MLDTLLAIFGPEAVSDLIGEMAKPDIEEDFNKHYSHGVELLENNGGDIIPDESGFDLVSLGTVVSAVFHRDVTIGMVVLSMALRVAYRLGEKHARLGIFKSAQIQEETK